MVAMTRQASFLTRRTFLAGLGHGSLAIAVVSLVGCGPATASVRPSVAASTPSPLPPETAPPSAATGAVTWERVAFGWVSAYLLVRAGEVAVVDTGLIGSEGTIEAALTGIGLGWDAVGHVIFTHLHGDHAGSSDAVLTAAADAVGYAGAADVAGIVAPRPLTALADGDRVFDLRIISTPGHTAGHVAVLDEVGGILVAGDALRTDAGQAIGPDADFSADMDEAVRSLAKLGELTFETLLVGHGDPIETGASAQVAALAAG